MRGLMFASVAVAMAAAAQAKSPESFPTGLREGIAALDQICSEFGGGPGESPDLVKAADLTGDGVLDYLVDLNAYDCAGAVSAMGAGQSGAGLSIYVGDANGGARDVYDDTSYGARIGTEGGLARVWVDLGGVPCGQANAADVAFSDMQFCSRPLDWDAPTRTFVYAPLSEARPIQ